MVNGAFVVRLVLLLGVRSSVAANSVTLDVLSASGSCGQGLPSILDRDAAMMAATLPSWRLAPWFACPVLGFGD